MTAATWWSEQAAKAAEVRTPEQASAHTVGLVGEFLGQHECAGGICCVNGADPVLVLETERLDHQNRSADPAAESLADMDAAPSSLSTLESCSMETLHQIKAQAEARIHDIDAIVADRRGHEEWAAYYRCSARAWRTRDAKDDARAAAAFVHAMATDHVRNGTMPAPGSHRVDEIVAAVKRLKGEAP